MSRYVIYGVAAFAGFSGAAGGGEFFARILGPISIEIAIGALVQMGLAFAAGLWLSGDRGDFGSSLSQPADLVAMACVWVGIGQLAAFPIVGIFACLSSLWSVGIGAFYFLSRRIGRSRVSEARTDA